MLPTNPTEILLPKLLPRRKFTGRQPFVMPYFEAETQAFLEDVSDLNDTIRLWEEKAGIPGILEANVANFPKIELYRHARNPVEAIFDFVAGVWRYIVSGRKVPVTRLALGGIRVAKSQERVLRDLTIRLINGEINQQEWYDQMRKNMKDQYRASWLASIGGVQNYDRTEISRFGWAVRPQYRWLDNFLLEIQTGKQPLNAFAIRRAGMYARAGNAIYQNNLLKIAERNGKTEVKRVLGVTDDHCHPDKKGRPGCVELAALGWVPMSQAVPIGDASCYCVTTPKSRILTKEGWKNFFEIDVGDLVFTHQLRWRRVTSVIIKLSESYHQQVYVKAPTGKLVGATQTHRWLTKNGWENANCIDSNNSKIYNITNLFQEVGYDTQEVQDLWFQLFQQEQDRSVYEVPTNLSMQQQKRLSCRPVSILCESKNSNSSMEKTLNTSENVGGNKRDTQKETLPLLGLDCEWDALDKEIRWQILLFLLGRKQKKVSISVPISMDFGSWKDTRGTQYPSQEWRSIRRQIRKLRAIDLARTFESSFVNAAQKEEKRIPLQDLRKKMESLDTSRQATEILFGEMLENRSTLLYDITVEDDHSYILEGLVSHNSNCLCRFMFR